MAPVAPSLTTLMHQDHVCYVILGKFVYNGEADYVLPTLLGLPRIESGQQLIDFIHCIDLVMHKQKRFELIEYKQSGVSYCFQKLGGSNK